MRCLHKKWTLPRTGVVELCVHQNDATPVGLNRLNRVDVVLLFSVDACVCNVLLCKCIPMYMRIDYSYVCARDWV